MSILSSVYSVDQNREVRMPSGQRTSASTRPGCASSGADPEVSEDPHRHFAPRPSFTPQYHKLGLPSANFEPSMFLVRHRGSQADRKRPARNDGTDETHHGVRVNWRIFVDSAP